MIRYVFAWCCLLINYSAIAQEVDKDLLNIKQRMDSVQHFTAKVRLDLDVAFINMPTKHAALDYTAGEEIKISSDDFMMLPKRGLDFSFSEVFEYPFITVNRGTTRINDVEVKTLNVIPDDDRSNLALATLYLDTSSQRIVASKITTKKEGTYELFFQYSDDKIILPQYVTVQFAVEKLKIPLNFMGSDTEIDRKKMRETDLKTGKIDLKIDYSTIKYR